VSVAFSAAVARPDYAQVVVAEPEVEDFVDAAGEALCSGADRLLAFQALTLPGLAFMLRYLTGLEDWQLPGHFNDDFADMQELSATIAQAIEAIIQRGGVA
jgi:hypothetical protein